MTALAVVQASVDGQWALLQLTLGTTLNVSVGATAFDFVLIAVFPSLSSGSIVGDPVVVLERAFNRWGFLVYVSPTLGEVARLRKGTGLITALNMPNYNVLTENDCIYYSRVAGDPTDWLAARIVNDTTDGEATYDAALKYLAPQRDYASIGAIKPYQKYSVSPDGRIKIADSDIYTTDTVATDVGPGVLVWDPRLALPPGTWPPTNFTFLKSALVGSHLRVVAVTAFEPSTGTGFEQVAFAPASEPAASVYIRLRAVGQGQEAPPFKYSYYNVSVTTRHQPQALDPAVFFQALLQEQQLWNATLSLSTAYTLPGQEGARQTDMAHGALIASLSLFVDLQPNYGDGADYWSPQVERGGSLPFQEIAVVQNLLDVGLIDMAADRLGWWMDAYITAEGAISTGSWELSCPFGFADGFSDLGEMMDIIARTAIAQLGYNPTNGTAWLAAHIDQAVRLTNYSYGLRLAAKANASTQGTPAEGLVWGPPEHDTCHQPGYYYHNNAWFIRGLLEMGKLLRDVCPSLCPAHASMATPLLLEALIFEEDFLASIQQTATFDKVSGDLIFIPPVAVVGMAPFHSMIESTLAEYSNFRYFSELLGADVLPLQWSVGLQTFRENTFGTVSGITRWSDHLDDMPSSYYLAAALRDDRLTRFFLLQYGHMANYMGRGTFTATEQLPIGPDANGFSRDYLWSYLEGGIDECVPSIMLPAIATRWQLVLERYDTNTIWLAKGAPRRWASPKTGGYQVSNAATRFGWVTLAVQHSARTAGDGENATATVMFSPSAVCVALLYLPTP